MKKIISVTMALVLLMCTSLMGITAFADESGRVYYVDSLEGNDENSGLSENEALKTLAKASENTYSAGDKILLKAGEVFKGTFEAKGDGTEESPIIFSAYGDTEKEGMPLITVEGDNNTMKLRSVAYWIVDGIEMTAPEGGGILIEAAEGKNAEYITVKNCKLHDILNIRTEDRGKRNSGVYIYTDHTAFTNNITVTDCEIYAASTGIQTNGTNIEFSREYFKSAEESYSKNIVFENLTIYDIAYDAVIFTSVDGAVLRNSSLIGCCRYSDSFQAPVWMHHVNNVVVENCEVAGTKNTLDGMTVDFDGWTTNSTYQYVYSHDNTRFMKNCTYDNTTKNSGNTVRYCLSVNDNKRDNWAVCVCNSQSYDIKDAGLYMDNFKFYNNTLINSSALLLTGLKHSVIANNIFAGTGLNLGAAWCPTYFTVKFQNNCFYKFLPPLISVHTGSVFTNPGFAGGNEDDVNSYMLKADSPLIGKGIKACEDMGEKDFYGNPLTESHNIGCYEGPGVGK